jgi:hypothetical protein
MRNIDRHIYIPEDLWGGLLFRAKQQQVSASKMVRQLIAAALPVRDEVRNYSRDGRHTAERQQEDRLRHILSKVR